MLREALPEIVTKTLPGPKAQSILERRHAVIPNAIGCVYPAVIERGAGAIIEDVDGNRFLDWIGGVGVLNIGYSHPEVVQAVQAQAERYFHAMFNVVTHEGYVALGEELCELAPVRGEHKKPFLPIRVPKPTKTRSKSPGPTPNDPILSSFRALFTAELS